MNEGAALRVLSFLTDSSQRHVDTLINERRKVNVIGEEHEPDEVAEVPVEKEDEFDPDLLPPEKIKEFFKTVESGSLEKLEDLFDTTVHADPNMTEFTESLLMAAIRAQRYKVAEYLIDQMGINVNHSTDLFEFRPQTQFPVRERSLSCRDLAYEKGMMDLVDLIDIASNDVRPSVKRFLQQRLKKRLDQIHQSFLKRMNERTSRLIIQQRENENRILEEDEQEKTIEESVTSTTVDSNVQSKPPPSSFQPITPRQYKSHIEETIQRIQSKNSKSIEETGRKYFRFSGYTLRYRLVESERKRQRPKQQLPLKAGFFSEPTPSTDPSRLGEMTTTALPSLVSRPTTSVTTPTANHRSTSEVSARIHVRETRTSICRSARSGATSRTTPVIHTDTFVEAVPPSSITTKSAAAAPVSTTLSASSTHTVIPHRRLLTRRIRPTHPENFYVPQLQHAIYNDPRHFMPVTLKATAVGLPTNTRLIRD